MSQANGIDRAAVSAAARDASALQVNRDPRLRSAVRAPVADPFSEIGTTGLRQFGGFVLEEWLNQLAGRRAAWVYREMLDNSSVVGSIMFAIEMLARQAEWRVEGSDEEVKPGLLATDFVHQCMHDMSHTWGDFVSEALSMLPYGWAWHEEVFKKRAGEQPDLLPPPEGIPATQEDDSPASSKYDDGLIGWRKLPIRAQETLMRWEFRGYSGLVSMEQIDWHGGMHMIPIEKSLLFRTKAARGNPEGRSILRNAYEAWFYMKNVQSIEAIGIERDLAGLPELTPPDDLDIFASQNEEILKRAQEIVQSVRRDENEGIVLPAKWKFRLVSAAGARQIDTDEVVRRYRQEIASSVLADFILVGLDNLGSYAMVDVKAELFGLAVDAVLDMICEVINRYAIPRLFRLNGFRTTSTPRINHSSAGRIDLQKVGEFLYKLAGAGAPIPWSQELIEQLFGEAGLPANFPGETTQEVHKAEDADGSRTADIGSCARCGDDHTGLRFALLGRPVSQADGSAFTHWAPCPNTGQPIMMEGSSSRPLSKAEQSSGAMVALYPSWDAAAQLAQVGGEPREDLHVTLAYLGDAAGVGDAAHLAELVAGWAAACAPLAGEVSGVGHFTAGPEPVTYASVDAPGLSRAREHLLGVLKHGGFDVSQEHGFTPHITLAYDDRDARVENVPLRFDHVALVLGDHREVFRLRGVRKAQSPDEDGVVPVARQLAARRPALAQQLEHEIAGALGHLGEQAASAYLSIAQKARRPSLSALVNRVMSQLDIQGWIDGRLRPLLRNAAGRVAGDTQRVLQQELDAEITIAVDDVEKLEGAAGAHLAVSDIEPQVREAIARGAGDGFRPGDNPAATALRIRDMVPPGRFVHAGSNYRSQLIARQETAHMQRLASLAAYSSMPRIESVRVRDGIFGEPRSDDECIDRSGEVIPLEQATALAPELHPQCTVSYDPVVSAAQPTAA
jgi:2'-5' RNA ligase